jgi:hypothetical protein
MTVVLRFHKANEVEIHLILGIGSSGVAKNSGGLMGGFEGWRIVEEVGTGSRGKRNCRVEEMSKIRGGFFGLLASYVYLEKGSVYQ